MARETSAEAYREGEQSGEIAASKHRVLARLLLVGPSTAAELWAAFPTRSIDKSKISARLSELRSLQLVRELPARCCMVTRKRAIVWEAIHDDPAEALRRAPRPPKRPTARAALAEYRALLVGAIGAMVNAGGIADAIHYYERLRRLDESNGFLRAAEPTTEEAAR